MKKYLFSALVTFAGLFALAASAQAQTGDVLVQIKQDFTAGGKAFPAGTYKVLQSFPGTAQTLVLRNQESGGSAFLIPTAHDALSSKQPEVKLTRVGDVYYLTEVATELGVYTLAPARVETRTAKATDRGVMSPSGSN
ncbi:MAG: hypothetical protein LAO18_02560 [Acidobacteriia bacterium]|nr:hypothetical protein [Terriglobia bacterium]